VEGRVYQCNIVVSVNQHCINSLKRVDPEQSGGRHHYLVN